MTDPSVRRLRVYAVDPSFSTRLDTTQINEVTVATRWEPVEPGPVGEYLQVEDVDPTGRRYRPVDLDSRQLLAQDGWAPSEGNPQFHQQMVYAVAMKTIESFENALGRVALWAPQLITGPDGTIREERYVQRLRIYPHALRAQNAFYSPDRKALLLGYFKVPSTYTGRRIPGGKVFTAVSHDIIAH